MSDDLLRNIRIAKPCKASWESMTGDERVRHCALCNLKVYNFSKLKQSEILDLLESREGRLCGRLYARLDGTVLTSDCPIGAWSYARSRIAWACICLLFAATGFGFFIKGKVDSRPDSRIPVSTAASGSVLDDFVERGRQTLIIGALIEAVFPRKPEMLGVIAIP